MINKSFFADTKNIIILFISILLLSSLLYIVFSPSSYQRANKVLEQQYKDLEKDKKQIQKNLLLLQDKYSDLEKKDSLLQLKIKKTDLLISSQEYKIYILDRDYKLYKSRYDQLNKEYWSKKTLTTNKTGDELTNSLKKRFNK